MANSKVVSLVVTYIAFINFMVYIVIFLIIGGGALNGKIEDGHYYVGNHHVYRDREVSESIFNYSKYHGYSVLVTCTIALITVIIYRLSNPEDKIKFPGIGI
jgi:hypothetical protein